MKKILMYFFFIFFFFEESWNIREGDRSLKRGEIRKKEIFNKVKVLNRNFSNSSNN
jgi:hypothetical protein